MHLVLNTYGTYLAVENGNFVVKHKDGKKLISPDKVKTISIGKSSLISSDAAILALENDIDVIFVDGIGRAVGRIWTHKFGSVTTIRRNQLDFTLSAKAIDWIRKIILEKMDNQIALLLTFDTDDNVAKNTLNRIINRINDYKTKIKALKGENIAEVSKSFRGWEGASSRAYFEGINLFLPEKYRFKERSQHPAKDLFNAMLNYGYGMLYAKIEAELIRAGIDPYIGVMHREDYNRPVLTFDVIEKFRVWIDYVVINLLMNDAIDDDSYRIEENGSVFLEGLSKRILIQSVNDYLEEIISIDGTRRSRSEQIAVFCRKLAKTFTFFSSL